MTTGKTIALTRWSLVGKVMSLLFNMLSRLVIAFLPRSKRLLISRLQSPSAVILEPPQIKSHCFHCLPIHLPWSDGTKYHDLHCLNIQKTKIMAFGTITSWEIDGETVETVSGFILGGSKITADGDYSHEIKRCLVLGRKVI